MRYLAIIALLFSGFAMPSELPDLGEPSPLKIYPAVCIVLALIVAEQTIKGCNTYPCAHYAHVASGAIISASMAHYYGEPVGWTAGIAFSIGTELYGKYAKEKNFNIKDVAGRGIGTVGGIWISRSF